MDFDDATRAAQVAAPAGMAEAPAPPSNTRTLTGRWPGTGAYSVPLDRVSAPLRPDPGHSVPVTPDAPPRLVCPACERALRAHRTTPPAAWWCYQCGGYYRVTLRIMEAL